MHSYQYILGAQNDYFLLSGRKERNNEKKERKAGTIIRFA